MSKFKAVATETIPKELLEYLDSKDFAQYLLYEVLGEKLRVENPNSRPAEHYVQKMDPVIEVDDHWGIELTLSKISVLEDRDFAGALRAMESILTDAVRGYVPVERRVQIFCVIATDTPVPGTNSTLFEMEQGVWVEGKAEG